MKRQRRAFLFGFFCTILISLCSQPLCANSVNQTVTLDPNHATYVKIGVENSYTSLILSIVEASGDIDMYVKKGVPATGTSVSELEADSDFMAEGPSWREVIRIDQSTNPPLTPGDWYVTLVNWNSYTTQITLQATSNTSDSSAGTTGMGSGGSQQPTGGGSGYNPAAAVNFVPETGLWYNSSKPGHGVDLELSGHDLAAVWYTYNPDGTPVWYLAMAPLNGGTWTATLNKYHWSGTSATPTPVGNLTINFSSPVTAKFSWTINGQSGTEPIERFYMADQVPAINYTGLWYNSTEPGYGYSIDTQGDQIAIVAYFYDSSGEPRWALNASGANDLSSPGSVPALSFFGSCPNCQDSGFSSAQAGTITRQFLDSTHAKIGTQIQLPAPISSNWTRSEAQVELLSKQVDNKRLDLALGLDAALGYLAQGSESAGGFMDAFDSLDMSNMNNSTCPVVNTGDMSNLNLSGPMHIPVSLDFGSGCTDKNGNHWSGSINLPVDATLSIGGIDATVNLTANNVVKNGQKVLSGTASLVAKITQGSNDLSNGNLTINLNLVGPGNEQITGTVAMTFSNVDLSDVLGGMGDSDSSFSLSDLTGMLKNGGSFQITLNNVHYGNDYASGTISGRSVSADSSQLTFNLQTNKGPVSGTVGVRSGSQDSQIILTSQAPMNIMGYSVTFNNLMFDATRCSNAPVDGSVNIQKGSNSGSFRFDGTCLGYVYQPL